MFAPLLHCNRNCLSWSLLFDVSHNTRSDVLPRRFHARHQYPPPPLLIPTWRPFYTSRRHGTRDIHRGTIEGGGGGRDPKQKETERRAFELNYFHFRTRSASLFVPANGIHRDAVAMGRVGFRPRSAVGRVSVSLSLPLSLYD